VNEEEVIFENLFSLFIIEMSNTYQLPFLKKQVDSFICFFLLENEIKKKNKMHSGFKIINCA